MFTKGAETLSNLQKVVSEGLNGSAELVSRLEAERIRLHTDLQRCMYEIQQRDQYFQQVSSKVRTSRAQLHPSPVKAALSLISNVSPDIPTPLRCSR